jgi:hypothetical protein
MAEEVLPGEFGLEIEGTFFVPPSIFLKITNIGGQRMKGAIFIQRFLCARYYAKYIIYDLPFNPPI